MSVRLQQFKQALMCLAVLAIILYAAAPNATADVIFSNFITSGIPASGFDTNPADSYFLNQSPFGAPAPVDNPTFCGEVVCPEILAVQFTPASNYLFSQAQLALALQSGTNTVDIFLETDSSGLPGSILSSFQVDNALTSTPGVIQFGASALLTGSASPELMAGMPYWLVANPPAADTVALWSVNSLSPLDVSTNPGDVAGGCNLGPSNFAINPAPGKASSWLAASSCPRPAFEIDGSPFTGPPPSTVPEPGSIMLLGSGLAGLLIFWKRERATAAHE
ncbi:MAG: PEP-CTERM sorting domain-containing protein [Terriglobia bacterium]